MTAQTKQHQGVQDNRYVNQGAEPEKAAGKNLSPESARSPSHATEKEQTAHVRAGERAEARDGASTASQGNTYPQQSTMTEER